MSEAEVGEDSFKGYFAGVRTVDNSLVLGAYDFAYHEAAKVPMPDPVRGHDGQGATSAGAGHVPSMARARPMTSSVNSVVLACPCRSAVRMPAARAASAASRIACPACW